jgi:hypothetical protein
MRRMDLHPQKKLRNPQRHIRALRRWQANTHLHLPSENKLNSEEYSLYLRLPVYKKVSDPPRTTPELQRECIMCMIGAAQTIRSHLKLKRAYRLAVLLQTPNLFHSEVTVFFDKEYLKTFLPPKEHGTSRSETLAVTTKQADFDLVETLDLHLPSDFEFLGGYRMIEEDFVDHVNFDYHRWVILEREHP